MTFGNDSSLAVIEDSSWTIRTDDGKPSAQWEYTLLMTEHGIEILAK